MSILSQNEPQNKTFRTDHKIYLLTQQLSEAKTTLQLKTKQIYYLSSQIVSLKQQYGQKVLNLQKIVADDKKQLADLRIRNKELFTTDRHKQKQKLITLQLQLKQQFQEKIKALEQHHRILQARLKEKQQKQLQIQKQKYETLLSIEKNSLANYEKYLEIQRAGSEDFANKMESQNKQVSQQKIQLQEQISGYLRQLSAIKQQLHVFTLQNENKQRQRVLEISNLNRKIEKLQQLIDEKNQEKIQIQDAHEQEIEKLMLKSQRQQAELEQYKELISKKDAEITRLIDIQSIKEIDLLKYQSQKNIQLEFTSRNNCNHQGYITQLQKNIQLLTLENKNFLKKIKQWGADVDIEKSVSIRLSQLSEVTQQAQSTYNRFKNMLISRSSNKKGANSRMQPQRNRLL